MARGSYTECERSGLAFCMFLLMGRCDDYDR